MKPAKLTEVVHTYVHCPMCGAKGGRIDLNTRNIPSAVFRSWGPWYCDKCGQGYRGTVNIDGSVEVTIVDKRQVKELVVLQRGPLLLFIEGSHITYKDEEAFREELINNSTYYYEEHTCPVNYLQQVKGVFLIKDPNDLEDVDTDPHGIFSLVHVGLLDEDIDWGGGISDWWEGELGARIRESIQTDKIEGK